MSGDPLLWFVSSPYDVATCIRCGMCECEATCDQGLVIKAESEVAQLRGLVGQVPCTCMWSGGMSSGVAFTKRLSTCARCWALEVRQ